MVADEKRKVLEKEGPLRKRHGNHDLGKLYTKLDTECRPATETIRAIDSWHQRFLGKMNEEQIKEACRTQVGPGEGM